jgi:hypothetical protein
VVENKKYVEVLTVIRERIHAIYNLRVLNHPVSTPVFIELYFMYMYVKL